MSYGLRLAAVLGLLINVYTHPAFASEALKTITCTEFSGGESDGPQSDGEEPATVGLYKVALDKAGNVLSLQIKREASDGLLAIAKNLEQKNVKFKHDLRSSELSKNWGIAKFEAVEAIAGKNESIVLNINDHSYAGPIGSTVQIKTGGKKFNSAGTNTMDCVGDVMFPAQAADAGSLE